MKHLETLQKIREDLFQLYSEAKVDRNKEAVLSVQLDTMRAMAKIKKILGIPLDSDDKKNIKT